MWRAHHYAGRGGPVSFAIAALDTALWDLKGRTLREPLWRLLGGHRPEVRAYAGNIDLNFPREKLLEGVSRSLAAGYKSIKMRLGKPSLREDVQRVAEFFVTVPRDWRVPPEKARAELGPALEFVGRLHSGMVQQAGFPRHPTAFAAWRRP